VSLTSRAIPEQGAPAAIPPERPARVRLRRVWTVLFGIFAFEIGAFLIVFPWLDSWSLNHLPSLFPSIRDQFEDLWLEPYLRGAISGLGLVNLYIAALQIVHAIRQRKRD
jgi:hypothetical protein